jgi:phosphoserine phosphatase
VTGDGANDLGMIQAAGSASPITPSPRSPPPPPRDRLRRPHALLYAQGYRRDEFAD